MKIGVDLRRKSHSNCTSERWTNYRKNEKKDN